MKRLVAIAAAMACLSMPSAHAQIPGAFGSVSQSALSLWMERAGGEIYFYAAYATRGPMAGWSLFPYVSPDEILGMGAVAKGKCKKFKHGMSCSAQAPMYPLDLSTFTYDPLMGSAHMIIGEEGHDVLWTGLDEIPYAYTGHSSDLSYVSVGAGSQRRAAIEGTIFGKELARRSPSFSALFQGADVYVFTGLRYTALVEDGRFSIRTWIANR